MSYPPKAIQERAAVASRSLAWRLKRKYQQAPAGLLVDQGAKNLWDELCMQTQTDSPWIEIYKDQVISDLTEMVAKLPPSRQRDLWLVTDHGQMWLDEEFEDVFSGAGIPISFRQIAQHVAHGEVMYDAMNYENPTIRAFTGM